MKTTQKIIATFFFSFVTLCTLLAQQPMAGGLEYIYYVRGESRTLDRNEAFKTRTGEFSFNVGHTFWTVDEQGRERKLYIDIKPSCAYSHAYLERLDYWKIDLALRVQYEYGKHQSIGLINPFAGWRSISGNYLHRYKINPNFSVFGGIGYSFYLRKIIPAAGFQIGKGEKVHLQVILPYRIQLGGPLDGPFWFTGGSKLQGDNYRSLYVQPLLQQISHYLRFVGRIKEFGFIGLELQYLTHIQIFNRDRDNFQQRSNQERVGNTAGLQFFVRFNIAGTNGSHITYFDIFEEAY